MCVHVVDSQIAWNVIDIGDIHRNGAEPGFAACSAYFASAIATSGGRAQKRTLANLSKPLNAEHAKIWPNITVKKAPPPDSKEWEGKPDKLKYFSPNPGAGD